MRRRVSRQARSFKPPLGNTLDRTSDTTLILRRLDRLGRADERTQRDLELLSEAFVVWVRVWFAHAPRINDDAKEFARRTGESRFAKLMEHVAEQFMGGHRFIDDLPREVLAEDAELAHLATRVQSPEPANPPTGADGE